MAVDWDYYNSEKIARISAEYLPKVGQGDTMATQIVTVVSKLVYKWYNDGDVYDNTYYLLNWGNDLSSYANWLYQYTDENIQNILEGVKKCNEDDYEDLLKELTDTLFDEEVLEDYSKRPAVGSIYHCDGIFRFVEYYEDEEDEEDEEYRYSF